MAHFIIENYGLLMATVAAVAFVFIAPVGSSTHKQAKKAAVIALIAIVINVSIAGYTIAQTQIIDQRQVVVESVTMGHHVVAETEAGPIKLNYKVDKGDTITIGRMRYGRWKAVDTK